jgi:hypothetical protein
LTISPGNSRTIAQESGGKWTGAAVSQPAILKSGRLLGSAHRFAYSGNPPGPVRYPLKEPIRHCSGKHLIESSLIARDGAAVTVKIAEQPAYTFRMNVYPRHVPHPFHIPSHDPIRN